VNASLSPNADALEPGFDCVRTPWILGFMAFQQVSDPPVRWRWWCRC